MNKTSVDPARVKVAGASFTQPTAVLQRTPVRLDGRGLALWLRRQMYRFNVLRHMRYLLAR